MCIWCRALYFNFRSPDSCDIQVADRLEAAVTAALDKGYRTGDLMSPGMTLIGCSSLSDVLVQIIEEPSLTTA